MGFRLNISPAVKLEMAEAFSWYAEKNAEAADNFRRDVLATFDLVSQHPERFPLWDDMVRRLVMKHYPYAVYYTVGDQVVHILAVGHTRRRAGYWQNR